jgi:hypothetical protein
VQYLEAATDVLGSPRTWLQKSPFVLHQSNGLLSNGQGIRLNRQAPKFVLDLTAAQDLGVFEFRQDFFCDRAFRSVFVYPNLFDVLVHGFCIYAWE